jgi:predicted nucleic acid-binding protein
MQRQPDPVVVAWLDRQPSESVWITAITVFEIQFGIELLAPGRRRHQLDEAFRRALAEDLEGRILPFDDEAAREAGRRAAEQRTRGRVVDFRDVAIAGIIAARRATLATRNLRHFKDLRIAVVNPWAGTAV